MTNLKDLQSLDLRIKVPYSEGKLIEFIEYCGGVEKVYISFSGGKDSTVLCDIANKLYPNIKMVFVDTGLEFPEIKEFVQEKIKGGWNIDIIRPKMSFKQVIEKYGYPVIGKIQAMAISRYRNTKSEKQKDYRLNGAIKNGKKQVVGVIAKKWHKLAKENKFKISNKCCEIMKEAPMVKYGKETKKMPIIGTMASESNSRQQDWIKYSCNAFNLKTPRSKPLSIWLETDIWEYIKLNGIEVAKPYAMGYERTGCVFCAYGCHLEKGMNRFQRLEITHPKLHKYVIENLGFDKVLKEIGVNYKSDDILKEYDVEERKEQKTF